MLDLIYHLPEQLQNAWVVGRSCSVRKRRKVDNVVITGMGGSAIGGEIVKSLLLADTSIPVMVWRDYRLPPMVGRRTVLFASSYSGNTEETIAAYLSGRERGVQIFVLTSGGRLAEMAAGDGVPLIKIPSGMPPRAAIGFMSIPILVVLNKLGLCHNYEDDIMETEILLKERMNFWRRRASALGNFLFKQIPIIYSMSRVLDWVGYRWQCQLNENAKVIAHHGCLPEQSHNEVMGFGAPDFINKRIFIIGLFDKKSAHHRTLIRFQEMVKLLRGYIAGFRIYETEGKSLLARMFSLSVFGDLVSVMLAKQRGVDPLTIPRIDELKGSLSRRKM